ncbi:MAG: sigma-54 dependent transcriptional regulator [Candidatus Eisenbacteria bacterium]
MSEYILIVDDEESVRRSLEMIFEGVGIPTRSCPSAEDGLVAIGESAPAVLFLDLQLPGMDGMELLRRLSAAHSRIRVIMISGHATIERAVEATRLGAFDFVEKPFGRDRVLLLARNALEAVRLEKEVSRLQVGDDREILGESESVRRLRDAIQRVAATDARVLILGESGTGKELVAHALHAQSRRSEKRFVRVNCAAIPEDLIEAELFGAAKGAYTGASSDRTGRFADADGGTLLLDEIGDMSLSAQAKVLRVLQEGEFEPVGSNKTVRVDVRVLAATHRDLAERVRDGKFREDLLYRLNVIPIVVPPLREREGDVRLLGARFLHGYAKRHELAAPSVTADAWAALERHPWPGNIRELKNLIERVVILYAGREVDALALGLPPGSGTSKMQNAAGMGGAAAPSTGVAPAGHDGSAANAAQPGAGGQQTGVGLAGSTDPTDDTVHPANAAPVPDSTNAASLYGHLSLRDARDAVERDLIRDTLERCDGNVTKAAEALGLERTHLHKRIRHLGLKED